MMNPRAKQVLYKEPFTLSVLFDNNETKEFNLIPYLIYPVYEKLKDISICRNVRVEDGIVVWDAETDLDPDLLYLESKTLIKI